jgi:hypothetical protein
VPTEGKWEAGFEVCFYRDLWQLQKPGGQPFSWKRTFDLCLFGDEAIVIIEAKAAERFATDQTASFMRDISAVGKQAEVRAVRLMGLCSSKYDVEDEIKRSFTGLILTWKELAHRYGNDEVLLRADDIFEGSKAFSSFGRNSNVKLTGAALLDAFQGGAGWWVGRGGGLQGESFREDIRSGRWRTQRYEVNTTAAERPSPNYFDLGEFIRAVGNESPDPNRSS